MYNVMCAMLEAVAVHGLGTRCVVHMRHSMAACHPPAWPPPPPPPSAFRNSTFARMASLLRLYDHRGIPLPVVRRLARQVLVALDYLHTQCHIIHTGALSCRSAVAVHCTVQNAAACGRCMHAVTSAARTWQWRMRTCLPAEAPPHLAIHCSDRGTQLLSNHPPCLQT